VSTDNALNYRRSHAFLEAMAELEITHVSIPAYHPRANGKVERFNRTILEEWAYVRLYTSNAQRLRALDRTASGVAPIPDGSPTTITADLTPRWEANRPGSRL
jgi:transposase InsO family protein